MLQCIFKNTCYQEISCPPISLCYTNGVSEGPKCLFILPSLVPTLMSILVPMHANPYADPSIDLCANLIVINFYLTQRKHVLSIQKLRPTNGRTYERKHGWTNKRTHTLVEI